MSSPSVRRDGDVLRVDLPGTPLDAGLAQALLDVLPAPDDLDAPPVLLIAGTADGRFAPLGDRDEGGGGPGGGLPAGLRDGGPGGAVVRCVEAVAGFDGVVVAALTGDAAGCGAELALACDLRVAGEQARLHLPHVTHGLVPACGATQRLPRLCGPGAAARMLLLAEPVDGAEMCRLGIAAARCATPQETLDAATALAARLASQAPHALRACREAMRAGADLPLREGLRLEADLAVLLQTTADRPEGIRAFLERRAPHFTGS